MLAVGTAIGTLGSSDAKAAASCASCSPSARRTPSSVMAACVMVFLRLFPTPSAGARRRLLGLTQRSSPRKAKGSRP